MRWRSGSRCRPTRKRNRSRSQRRPPRWRWSQPREPCDIGSRRSHPMSAPPNFRSDAARDPIAGVTVTSMSTMGQRGQGSQAPSDPKLRARQAMLQGPVLATMLKLAGPTIVVLLAQVAVSVAETFYVSYLGTEALAGVALVFPILMLMTMMSNGAIGGGVAAAVARAIGGGRKDDADALGLHALLLAVVFGAIFPAATLLFGRMIYCAVGG